MASEIEKYGGWRGLFLYTLLSSLISGAVVGGTLKWLFDRELESWRSHRAWESAALAEVIAPAVMHLERTEALASRYRLTPRFGEAAQLRDSNMEMRALLLSKAHLLPSELIDVSQCLLTHYDIWLKRYDLTLVEFRRVEGADPLPDSAFDVGFAALEDSRCGKFPPAAPVEFRTHFDALRRSLYELEATSGVAPPSMDD